MKTTVDSSTLDSLKLVMQILERDGNKVCVVVVVVVVLVCFVFYVLCRVLCGRWGVC